MSALTIVSNSEQLDLYCLEQTVLLGNALKLNYRIHKAYRRLKEDRERAYLKGDWGFYDFYKDAAKTLFFAQFDSEKQVMEQSRVVDHCCNMPWLF